METGVEILLLERAHRRVGDEMARIAPAAQPVLLHDDGRLTRGGTRVDAGDLTLEVAWASNDLFSLSDAAVRSFMVTALKARGLRWFQSGAAGFEHPVFGALASNGARLTRSDGGAIAMAEFVVSSVLDVFQPNPERRASQAAARWERHPFREVCGTHWLVIGLGAVGCEVATRARAFGARVTGVRRSPRGDEPVDHLATPDAVPTLLPEADVVVLSSSLNASTHSLADADFFARMREGAVLVNVGRGGLVDEEALLPALDAGRPGTAVLDVFATEPLPAESPLWRHPGVRLSAHCSAAGSGAIGRGDRVFLANLAHYGAGEPFELEVDASALAEARHAEAKATGAGDE